MTKSAVGAHIRRCMDGSPKTGHGEKRSDRTRVGRPVHQHDVEPPVRRRRLYFGGKLPSSARTNLIGCNEENPLRSPGTRGHTRRIQLLVVA